jgi:hypothetical protein
MLNLFQHLVVSTGYETLKQVQGDIPVIYTQTLFSSPPLRGGDEGEGEVCGFTK